MITESDRRLTICLGNCSNCKHGINQSSNQPCQILSYEPMNDTLEKLQQEVEYLTSFKKKRTVCPMCKDSGMVFRNGQMKRCHKC